jgi:integrase
MKGARLIDKHEIKTLLQAESPRDRMLVLVGLYFGTRISESMKLTFGDFKGQVVRIQSVKGSNDRNLVIPEEFKTELERLRQHYINLNCPVTDDTPLFLSQKKDKDGNCKPISREHACYIIKALRERYGLDERVSAHSFRKNFTTRIHELCNHNLPQVSVYTGHKSIDSLQAYIETTQDTNLTTQLGWL